jgi:outer membrane protein assembly factor BamB
MLVRSLPLALSILLLSNCSGSGISLHRLRSDPADWPTTRGANDNRGAVAERVDAVQLLWQRKTGGQAAGEPTVRGGYIFYSGLDRRLEIFRVATGKRVFRERFDGPVRGALPRDSVFQFSVDQNENRFFTYEFYPDDRRSSFRIANSRAAARRMSDSTLLLSGLDGTLYSHAPDGNIRWSVKTEGLIHTAPAIDDTTVFVATGRRVVALDTRDGTRRWRHQSSGAIVAAPAVDDRVYVGATDSIVYALDSQDGAMEWFAVVGGGVFTTPAVGENRLYFGANDGLIYALDKETGKTLWTYDTGAIANLSPTLSGDLLYAATQTGHLLGLQTADGSVVYNHELRSSAVIPPVVAAGRVFVADRHRRLYCFGRESESDSE